MMERLAVSTRAAAPERGDLAGQTWVPEVVLDAWGQARAAGEVAGVEGAALETAMADGPGPKTPPGLYAGDDRRIALNVIGADTVLEPMRWPEGTVIEGLETLREQALKGGFLSGGLVLLLIDILAALWLSGRLGSFRRAGTAAALVLAVALVLPGAGLRAQEVPDPAADAVAVEATRGVVLAHVLTGDVRVDEVAQAGLAGLGERLYERTSVEPESPMGVDIEADELAFYPFLYWPVTTTQPLPSASAYGKLNRYLRTGGMILFDTRDGDVAGYSSAVTPEAQALQRLAAGLDVPPLEQIPPDHVLTRTFYLLQDFPGRFNSPVLWVEAAPPDAEQAEGMPFRNLNDGVTPVVIGGNDWASAWAVTDQGAPMFPVGRGAAGEQQREIAWRFGVNLVMHVLTGNYKSDQVHVPALLERLGQ